jgi:hypothetical protein
MKERRSLVRNKAPQETAFSSLKGFDTSQKGAGHLIKETSKKSAPFSGLDVIGKVGEGLAAIPLKPVLIGAVAIAVVAGGGYFAMQWKSASQQAARAPESQTPPKPVIAQNRQFHPKLWVYRMGIETGAQGKLTAVSEPEKTKDMKDTTPVVGDEKPAAEQTNPIVANKSKTTAKAPSRDQAERRVQPAGTSNATVAKASTVQKPVTYTSKRLIGVNVLKNSGFENGLTNWLSWNPAGQGPIHAIATDYPYKGKGDLVHWSDRAYQHKTYQIITNLPDGTYVARVWVRSGGGQRKLTLEVTRHNHGEGSVVTDIGRNALPDKWKQMTSPKIKVRGGTVHVGVYSDAQAGNWADFDNLEFVRVE